MLLKWKCLIQYKIHSVDFYINYFIFLLGLFQYNNFRYSNGWVRWCCLLLGRELNRQFSQENVKSVKKIYKKKQQLQQTTTKINKRNNIECRDKEWNKKKLNCRFNWYFEMVVSFLQWNRVILGIWNVLIQTWWYTRFELWKYSSKCYKIV